MTSPYAIRWHVIQILRRAWTLYSPTIPLVTPAERATVEIARPRVDLELDVSAPMDPLWPRTMEQARPGAFTRIGWRLRADFTVITDADFRSLEEICAALRDFMDQIVARQTYELEPVRIEAATHGGETSVLDTENNVFVTTITYEIVVGVKT